MGFPTPIPSLYTQPSPPELFSGSPSEVFVLLFFHTDHNFPQKKGEAAGTTILKEKEEWGNKRDLKSDCWADRIKKLQAG